MNFRALNRWLLVPNILLLAGIIGGMALLVLHHPKARPIQPADLKSISPKKPADANDDIKAVGEYSLIFNDKTSLLSSTAAGRGAAKLMWDAIKLLQPPTTYKGRWEAFVQVPKNPLSYNPNSGPWDQLVVRVGDVLQMPPNPASARGRVAAIPVTVAAISANSITLTDADGETHVTPVGL